MREEVAVFIAFGLLPLALFAFFIFIWNAIKAWHYIQFQKQLISTGIESTDENNVRMKLVELKRHYQFYINREDLKREWPNLADELRGMQKVWAIWYTGGNVHANNDLLDTDFQPREFKLILTNPDDDYMMCNIEPMSRGDIAYWKQQIRRTADHASQKGVVYFYTGLIGDSLLIADPKKLRGDTFSKKAWARVDTTVPYGATLRRSSYRIVNEEAPRQFAALVKHFRTLLGMKDRIIEYKDQNDNLSSS